MADAFIGEIRLFAFDWAPQDWLFCDGTTHQSVQYQALNALLGARFGGDGQRTFGVPDLRSKVAVNEGQPVGEPNNLVFAKTYGTETVSLTPSQIPTHTHNLNALLPPSGTVTGATAVAGTSGLSQLSRAIIPPATAINAYQKPPLPTSPVPTTIGLGISTEYGNANHGADPHENRMPYLVMGYYICALGWWPPNPN
jgi:microcystin-dependent protein